LFVCSSFSCPCSRNFRTRRGFVLSPKVMNVPIFFLVFCVQLFVEMSPVRLNSATRAEEHIMYVSIALCWRLLHLQWFWIMSSCCCLPL
jgi:hypothetical protein